MPLPHHYGRPAAGALIVGLLATGCGSDAKDGPAAGGPATAVRVTLTDADCRPDPATVPAGTVTFTITNQGGSGVSEAELAQGSKILGEKEGLTPGLSGSFSLTLTPGSYQLYCPNAKTERTAFTVTGAASGSASSTPGTTG